MADYEGPLSVKTKNDADERLQAKIVDPTTVAQAMAVDSDSNAHVEVHGNDPAAGDETLALSETGRVNPDGDYDGTNNTKPGSVGVISHDRNATPGETHQNVRVTGVAGSTDTTHHSMDVAVHDGAGNGISNSNPLPVKFSLTSGTAVHDYKTAASIAKAASDNHDYVVTAGKTLTLTKIQASARGAMKIEVLTGPSGSLVAVLTAFTCGASLNYEYTFGETLTVAATDTVRVKLTNLDNGAMDVYSLIEGEEN